VLTNWAKLSTYLEKLSAIEAR